MNASRPLRFHWSLSQAGNPFRRAESLASMSGLPDFDAQLALCRRAEECGIESMLMALGFTRPDPLLLTVALGLETRRIGFMVACRPGLVSPTYFVQQLNTVSQLLGGRLSVNVVSGHTPAELRGYGCFLEHDERLEQAGEFLAVCRMLWENRTEAITFHGKYFHIEDARVGTPFTPAGEGRPELYVGGNSPQAAELAARHADCLFRIAEPPVSLAPAITPVLEQGKEVGLLVALIARPTHTEAVNAAANLVRHFGEKSQAAHRQFEQNSDSVAFTTTYRQARGTPSGWLTDTLWNGAVPFLGAPAIALVGSAAEVAEALVGYQRIGVSQFLLLGWPDLEEMTFFGHEVLPLVRKHERAAAGTEVVRCG